MTAPVFLLDPMPDGDQLLLVGEEGRHAARVRRIGVGESVVVSDGHGRVAECLVSSVRADGLVLSVIGRWSSPVPVPRLVVVQALPKTDRAELAVELLTELGVDEIVPWAAARSITQWRDARGAKGLQRWRRAAREAAKQSRRAWVPDVTAPASTADVAARLAGACGLVLHEHASTPLARSPLAADGEIVLVVGPEGGVSPAEIEAFTAVGASAVRLGEPVLRTSTAGAAALAVLSVRLGRWS